MREKIFYVINLDKNRISLLSLLLLGLLFSFFFLGVSIGKGKNQLAKNSISSEIKDLQANSNNTNNAKQNPEVVVNSENAIDSNSLESNASSVANLDSTNKANLEAPTSTTNITEQTTKKQNETIALANRPPVAKVSNSETSTIVDLQSNSPVNNYPTENTDRQEKLYKSKTIPKSVFNKKSPKKSVDSANLNYSIQLAAFTEKSKAEIFIKKIKAENPSLKERAFIKKANHHFLVRIGSNSNKDSLRHLLAKIKLDSNIRKNAILVKNS